MVGKHAKTVGDDCCLQMKDTTLCFKIVKSSLSDNAMNARNRVGNDLM